METKQHLKKKNLVDGFVDRLTQLRCNALNKETIQILLNEVYEIFKYLGFLGTPEIVLAIELLLFAITTKSKNQNAGQEYLGLKYVKNFSKKKALAFAVLKYILPYVKTKIDESVSKSDNTKVKKVHKNFNTLLKVVSFTNLIAFLKKGKYPSKTDRWLDIQQTHVSNFSRVKEAFISERELLQDEFTELFACSQPYIRDNPLATKIQSMFKSTTKETIQWTSNNTVCAICNELSINPCHISSNCPHIACYYCLKRCILTNADFACSICGVKNTAIEKIKFVRKRNTS